MKSFYGNYGIACIYKITNTKNGHFYIGQTKNLVNRHDAERNYAPCRKLWVEIKEHGWEHFRKDIVEMCDVSVLDEREKHYIDTLKPGLNTRGTEGDNVYSIPDETKKRMSIAKLNDKRLKRIKVYNLDTGEEFASQNEAAKSVGTSRIAISRACRGIHKTCKGFRWGYEKEEVQ